MKEWITEIISLFSCLIALAVPFIMDKIERKRQEDRDRQEMYVKAKILCSKLTYCVSYYTGNKQYSLFTEEANPKLYELTNAIFELLMKMKTIFRRKNHRLSLRQLETKLEEVSVSILPLSDIGPLIEFCVSVFRQNQEYHIINVHTEAYSPCLYLSREGGAVCAPQSGVNAVSASRESYFKGISLPCGRRT